MELRQLEYFIAVAEEASFTRAAERVHISQSGVSAQIRQLERDLGATLIDRAARAATPTTAGEVALEHARAALAAVGALRRAVDDVNAVVRGRLRVGMVTACTVTPLFDALSSFRAAHPGVEITLFEDTSDRLVASVRAGETDLALIGAAGAPPSGLGSLSIVRERVVAAVAPGHPLTGRTRVRLADVVLYPLVCLPKGTGIRTVFDEACLALDAKPIIALQASAPTAVADLASRELGVAILSESMAARHDGQLAAAVIDDVETPAILALVWSATPSPALRRLLDYSRAAFSLEAGTGLPV